MMSVAIRIRAVPILSPSFPRRGETTAPTRPALRHYPAEKSNVAAVRAIDLINSARIGPTEPLQSRITIVASKRLIIRLR